MRVREPLGLWISPSPAPLRFEGVRGLEAPRRAAFGGHLVIAVLAVAGSEALRDGHVWTHPDPWVAATPGVAFASSTMLGLTAALAIIAMTRASVSRFAWARSLYDELHPVARDMSDGQIFTVAALAGIAEEVLFRGLLAVRIGVVGAAMLFGLAHQLKVRGPTRWVWTAWATVMGLVVGSVFALTGSLVGPLLAHVVVNAANLAYLRGEGTAGGTG